MYILLWFVNNTCSLREKHIFGLDSWKILFISTTKLRDTQGKIAEILSKPWCSDLFWRGSTHNTWSRQVKWQIKNISPLPQRHQTWEGTFSALTVCNIHFSIWKYSKIIFMWSPFGPFWSVKHLNFWQKLPIRTAHHTFLESRHPEVTKNLYYVLSPKMSKKRYQLMDYIALRVSKHKVILKTSSQRRKVGCADVVSSLKVKV